MLLVTAGLLSMFLSPNAGGGEPVESARDAEDVIAEPKAANSFWEAVKGGESWLRLRYRFENVDQGGFASDAHSSTLRTVLGYRTARFGKWQGLIEFEDVSVVGDRAYNSTTNMVAGRPVVADPEGGEVNQAFVSYHQDDSNEARVGRQTIMLDNDRFVGAVPWRQNFQTFDAVSWESTGLGGAVDLFYAFISNVNRVFGDNSVVGDHRMASHILNVSHEVEGWGRGSVYAYLLDYDSADTLSTSTVGGRFDGKRAFEGFDLLYLGEIASQTDTGDNPTDIDAGYLHANLGAKVSGHTFKVGMEVLEGSGAPGDKFTTPLATLHAFNGWADQFLVTPDTGIEDVYFSAGTKVRDVKLLATYHEFSADTGGMDYGSEIDVIATYPVNDDISVGIKYADYDADSFATDTTKAWLWVALTF